MARKDLLCKSVVTNVIVISIVLWSLQACGVAGSCTFPSDIRGSWIRNRDSQVLTVTSTTVNGLALNYLSSPLPDFYCHTQSGDKYILASDFTVAAGGLYRYLVCWQLEKITGSAYFLYELTDDDGVTSISPVEPGMAQLQSDTVVVNTVCELGPEFFTVLIKDGAAANDVSTQCPPSLFADFQYTQCADSAITICPGRETVTVDYSACPAVLNSAGGVLSCMGYKEHGTYLYVNLYKHDSGNGVTCLRMDSGASGTMTVIYYSGDCSTAESAGIQLDLSSTKTCPLGSDSDDNTGAIVGSTITIAAVAAVAGVGVLFFLKKKQGNGKIRNAPLNMVSVNSTNSMTVKPSEAPVATTANGSNSTPNGNVTPASNGTPPTRGTPANYSPSDTTTTDGNPPSNAENTEDPFPSPSRNPHLPPLPNAAAPGEALRA